MKKGFGFITMMALKLIGDAGPMTGYAIIKKIQNITGRMPSSGTIYPMLKKLEEKGLITGESHGNKVLYTITEKGKEFLEEQDKLREYFIRKTMEHISLLDESLKEDLTKKWNMKENFWGTFNGNEIIPKLFDFFRAVKCAMMKGVDKEKILGIIREAREQIERASMEHITDEEA